MCERARAPARECRISESLQDALSDPLGAKPKLAYPNDTRTSGVLLLKTLAILFAATVLLVGCGHDRHRHDRDRDHNGIPDRYERNRDSDGDGVPDRYDRRPDNPRKY